MLTQVEGHVTWMHLRRLAGADQSAAAAVEQANAERALKHGIESFLSNQSGANRCGGYLKAAEKYLETANNLGMNTHSLSFINQRYKQLINECSFEFIVEKLNWINHPEEKHPCWEKNPAPSSFTFTKELEAPFGISAEKDYGNPRYLKGTHVMEDISGEDCNCLDLVAKAVHGDVDCSYSSKIIASWTLVKQCEALGSVGKELDKRDLKPPVKARIKDMLAKLDNPATTNTHVFIGWYIISTVKDNDQAQKILYNKDEYMTDLRKLLNGYCEKSKDVKELTDLVIMTDKEIVDIVNRFNQQYLREHILTPGQVTIKDWIADQQRDPNSVYHSYAGK